MFPYEVTYIVHVVLFYHTNTEEYVFAIKKKPKKDLN